MGGVYWDCAIKIWCIFFFSSFYCVCSTVLWTVTSMVYVYMWCSLYIWNNSIAEVRTVPLASNGALYAQFRVYMYSGWHLSKNELSCCLCLSFYFLLHIHVCNNKSLLCISWFLFASVHPHLLESCLIFVTSPILVDAKNAYFGPHSLVGSKVAIWLHFILVQYRRQSHVGSQYHA